MAFVSDEQELADDIFADPDSAFRNYSDLLHGPYIAALMRRAAIIDQQEAKSSRKGSSKERTTGHADAHEDTPKRKGDKILREQSTRSHSVSASTLSEAARNAFREAQEELRWTGPIEQQEAKGEERPTASKIKETSRTGQAESRDDDFGPVAGAWEEIDTASAASAAAADDDFGTAAL